MPKKMTITLEVSDEEFRFLSVLNEPGKSPDLAEAMQYLMGYLVHGLIYENSLQRFVLIQIFTDDFEKRLEVDPANFNIDRPKEF